MFDIQYRYNIDRDVFDGHATDTCSTCALPLILIVSMPGQSEEAAAAFLRAINGESW